MSSNLIDDLRQRIADRRVVVVAGSGVAAAATRGHRLSSWSGLIESGIEHAAGLPGVKTGRLEAARSLLDVGDSSALISAGELVTEMLGGREGGEYARWLAETVGSLKLLDSSVPEALLALGAPLATTNYDELIREASAGWERVTWVNSSGMLRALQGDVRAVAHLHGHWFEPRSVVLGVRSYEELAGSGPAQALQRAMATVNSLLFVGVGDGASDPNFGALRRWLAGTFPDSQYRHYRLCLDGEVDTLSAEHEPGERILPIGYGDRHEDLAEFLIDLAKTPSPRPAPSRESAAGGGAAALPAPPVTVGREEQIAEVAAGLLAEPTRPMLLNGPPGIGKTNLTLAALHHPEVVGRFGQRRWMARCETSETAAGLAGEIAATVGVTPGGDPVDAVLALLSKDPAVLALDNLETPWEQDTLAVEDLLGRIAAVAGTTLIASIRGSARPSGVRWAQPTQLQPLKLPFARRLFASLAPAGFDTPALDALLEEMGGIPLAVELLAYAADGEADLEHLAERWKNERVRLLQREKGDHPLLSIAVSLDTSWNSPAMTDAAKRLLSILGGLPDGVADDDLESLLPGAGPAAANVLRRRGLALEQAGRLRILPPVRHHLSDAHPPNDSDWQRATELYRERAATLGALAGKRGGGEAITTLSREAANIAIAIRHSLDGAQPERGQVAARAFLQAARFGGIDAASITDALLSAATKSEDAKVLADARLSVGILAYSRSDHDGARENYELAQQLYEEIDNVLGQANCILRLGDISLRRSDHQSACMAYQRAQPLYELVQDAKGQADCIQCLGESALRRSDYDSARKAFERAQPLYEEIGEVLGQANCIQSLGDIAQRHSDHDSARRAFERAQPLYEEIGELLGQGNCIKSLGDIAREHSKHEDAREAYKHSLGLYEQIGEVLGQANCIQSLGEIALEHSKHDEAREAYERAQPLYEQIGEVLGRANCILRLGDIAREHSKHDDAREAYEQSLMLYVEISDLYSVGITHERLGQLARKHAARCAHVSAAREAWASIKRDDLVALLATEFPDCPEP